MSFTTPENVDDPQELRYDLMALSTLGGAVFSASDR